MRPAESKLNIWIRVGIVLFVLLMIGAAIVLYSQETAPLTAKDVRWKVDLINDAAAVVVPQKQLDHGVTRQAHLKLFERVEHGDEINEEETAFYRKEYQGILRRNQSHLQKLDTNLTIITNLEMHRANNVYGHGVEGAHDHHDESVRSNMRDLIAELKSLSANRSSSFARVSLAIKSNKDLIDIILHLGTVPQTKSTEYFRPENLSGPIEEQIEAILLNFKTAQFEPINSPAYWTAIHHALDGYDKLVLQVQQTINDHLTPFERRIAGRWGGWQTVGPSFFEGYPPPRRPRP